MLNIKFPKLRKLGIVRDEKGFTLIEVLVAIGILALMAVLSWRGLDGMTRSQALTQQRPPGAGKATLHRRQGRGSGRGCGRCRRAG